MSTPDDPLAPSCRRPGGRLFGEEIPKEFVWSLLMAAVLAFLVTVLLNPVVESSRIFQWTPAMVKSQGGIVTRGGPEKVPVVIYIGIFFILWTVLIPFFYSLIGLLWPATHKGSR
jgi:hypothetical protein